MRGALDHLATTIVRHATRGEAKYTRFPFEGSKLQFKNARNGSELFKACPDAYNCILEHYKPYPDEDGDKKLWSLNRLWNDDKHRLLITTTSSGAASGNIRDTLLGWGIAASTFEMIGPGEWIIAAGLEIENKLYAQSELIIYEPDSVGIVALFPYIEYVDTKTVEICRDLSARFL